MTKTSFSYIYGLLGLTYLLAVIAAYFLNVDFILFCLALPWSMIVAFLSPLLGHMFGGNSLNAGLLLGALLNFIIFLKITVSRYFNFDD